MANMSFVRRALLLLIALVAVNATEVMQRPDNYKDAPRKFLTETPPKPTIIHKRANAKVSAAYFTNWGIYGANFRKFYSILRYTSALISSTIFRTNVYCDAYTDAYSLCVRRRRSQHGNCKVDRPIRR